MLEGHGVGGIVFEQGVGVDVGLQEPGQLLGGLAPPPLGVTRGLPIADDWAIVEADVVEVSGSTSPLR
jgi:hypothetical protein